MAVGMYLQEFDGLHLLASGVFPGLISKLSSESSNCLGHFRARAARARVFLRSLQRTS